MSSVKRAERLANLQAELKKCEHSRKMGLAGLVYGAILIVGALLITRTAWCSNETLKLVGSNVLLLFPLICGFIGINAAAYVRNRKKSIELRQQIQEISDMKIPGKGVASKQQNQLN